MWWIRSVGTSSDYLWSIPLIHNLSPMKNPEPLAPIAIGRHRDSPITNASAISPVAQPMSATPNSHLMVFR